MKNVQIPYQWVLLKLPNNFYKIFAIWQGGYLNAFNWRINSGIKSVEQDKIYYYFHGYSGSIYECKKESYGINSLEANIFLNKIISETGIKLIDQKEVEKVITENFCHEQ